MRSISIYLLLSLTCFQIQVYGGTFFDINDLNWSIRPTDDFYSFVNSRWLNKTTIPPSQTEWGSIYTMASNTSYQLKSILDELTQNGTSESPHPIGSLRRKLGDLYLVGLDEETIEKVGIEPLKETFIQLENVNTYQELILFIINWFKKTDEGLIFKFDVFPDDKNSTINMATWKVNFYFKNLFLFFYQRNFYLAKWN